MRPVGAQAFERIYKCGPLKWPKLLQVDPGREFMGAVSKEMESHKTAFRRGHVEIHCDQAIVERFNPTLAERLFGHQYAVEMLLPEGARSVAWPSDCDPRLLAFQLVRNPDFVDVAEVCASQKSTTSSSFM